jgi:hypothetical protein
LRRPYAGTDSNQRGQCSLVESEGALLLEDLRGAVESARVLCGGLESHLDDICGGINSGETLVNWNAYRMVDLIHS